MRYISDRPGAPKPDHEPGVDHDPPRVATRRVLPRLTNRAFGDLAIYMVGFGLTVGVLFPLFVVPLGVPTATAFRPTFLAATLTAGCLVAAVNFGLARIVVGVRVRQLAGQMSHVEGAPQRHPNRGLVRLRPAGCRLPVDSADELGTVAAAFNRLLDAVARSHSVEAAVAELSGVLAGHLELAPLGEAALDALLAHTNGPGGAIYLRRGHSITLLARRGELSEWSSPGDLAATVFGPTTPAATSARVPAATSALVPAATSAPVPGRAGLHVLPVRVAGEPIAAVVLPGPPPGAELDRLLTLLAEGLGVALHNALLHEQLARQAAVDDLTGLYNRRHGLGRLREELDRAARERCPVGVLLIDIDHFKSVNDTAGHPAGDKLLTLVAHTCRDTLRTSDVLVRYGGEEFLAVLPGGSPAVVAAAAERLRHAVAGSRLRLDDRELTVTVSVGGTCCTGSQDNCLEDLLQRADRNLYAAKHAGRNRCVTDTVAGERVRPQRSPSRDPAV